MVLLFGMGEEKSMEEFKKNSVCAVFWQVASPLRLASFAVLLIMIGNFFDWLDAVYQMRLHALNPLLATLVTILFCLYLYRVFILDKQTNK